MLFFFVFFSLFLLRDTDRNFFNRLGLDNIFKILVARPETWPPNSCCPLLNVSCPSSCPKEKKENTNKLVILSSPSGNPDTDNLVTQGNSIDAWKDKIMMMSSNGNIFRVTDHLCGEFTDVLFDIRPNKRLSKQWWGWWLRRYRAHYDISVMWHGNGLFHSVFLSLPPSSP